MRILVNTYHVVLSHHADLMPAAQTTCPVK
jgi:hypothetical protein